MHIAVILPRWVGDAVMATPLLRALTSHFGSRARITGVMRPVVADLLDGTGWLNGHVFYDRHGRNPDHTFSAAARALKGTMVLHLTRPDGDPLEMEMCFNGAATPKTEMTVALADRIAMDEGRMNGQEAFMTGKIKVQGDMGFLMQVAMATGR